MMLRIHHSHSKPSAGQSALLAAVWYEALQISPISIAYLTGGHRSRFTDGYFFFLKFSDFIGENHEQCFSDKGGGLLQVTA